ncbi:OPT family oligopeptide transporter [Xanthomonas rydalmerensis]|uniref:Oligopeptide transporter, OPT family n=1 Tax=Xanthomonas rydalmerensis TaxID=3046274 RepID=A0ABZ0JKC4_9XANT|nr:oligopeptide transporter, OPT family [Xanthomonas sp. DM-2023]WOS39434.1 oligopeptide transporter, OPT family [Xanthomonas sp. DM-2023]WOS43618.1 oligopeptide transporter, OPT family [Xanthomonas sp. DM-2023]WOS47799.1 oligopeptide transporter, OPT family [Xanthomonas sp. DM-2023]WOS51977.1 oligopeptide transporter, OPT family [Xanthomonas sp. DM-2023]WOS56161.1 oligopeptide transporter, OPT family [Xanthomonas sp. DM-2023]
MNNAAAPRQLTFRAVVLAIVLAVVLSAANAYLGLFAGLTIATAIPAAVVSMGVLRLLGGGSILENNIVQTGASAGSSIAAGVIFTIPALVIMGYWPDFKYWWVLGIAGMGGLLGVLFSVPLRRSMIVEDPLPFPEGKAAAEVLKAGENPGPGLKILGLSAAIGGLVKLGAASGLKVIPDTWAQAAYIGSSKMVGYVGTNLSPALLGVGYIVGLNVGIVVLSGSILSWHLAIPLYQQFFMNSDPALAQSLANAPAAEAAFGIWAAKVRYLGVGAMLIGGVWTLFSLRKSLLSGVKSGFAAARKSTGGAAVAETDRDLPMKWMLVALLLCTLPLLGLYQAIVGQWHVSVPMTIIMIVAGFLFVSVSGYLAGLIGSSNNPVSGITISTILFASAVLVLLLGRDSPIGAVAAIMIGAVVCCAAAVGGDNLQDLKAGYLVGATPWKQQLMLAIGAFSCALIMAPVLNLLAQAYGIGAATPQHPNALAAPQATLMASVAKGLFGGELPWTMIGIGAGVGAAIIALDEWLKKTGKRFRVPVLAAAIGIYLPLELMVPIFLGGLLTHLVERFHKIRADDEEGRDRVHRPGTLFAAGLITGEALMGIAIAVPIVASGHADVLALPEAFHLNQWYGLVLLAFVGWLLYRTGRKGEAAAAPRA